MSVNKPAERGATPEADTPQRVVLKGAIRSIPPFVYATPGQIRFGWGEARPLPEPGLPIIALPTTSGTGSEVTRVCVLSDPAHRRKASIRSDSMLPRLALVDPELTVSCPSPVTAHSGMDAFVQAVEAYVST